MSFVQHLSQSFDQLKMMAAACGLDLPEAVARGTLSGSRLRDGAFRCRGCNMAETCRAALAANQHLEIVPEYCANRALFSQLSTPFRQ